VSTAACPEMAGTASVTRWPNSAIARVVRHHGSIAETARQLAALSDYAAKVRPKPQHIGAWLRRGWAASSHARDLSRIAPTGITTDDLVADRMAVARVTG
jgi:hypothetical protein